MDQNINKLHPVEPSDEEVILGDNPVMEPGYNNIVTMNQKNHQITSRNFELSNKNTITMNLKIHQIKPRKITNNNLAQKNMSNLTIPHIDPQRIYLILYGHVAYPPKPKSLISLCVRKKKFKNRKILNLYAS